MHVHYIDIFFSTFYLRGRYRVNLVFPFQDVYFLFFYILNKLVCMCVLIRRKPLNMAVMGGRSKVLGGLNLVITNLRVC